MRISSFVLFIVFAASFGFSRRFLREWLVDGSALDGFALWGTSFVTALALAGLVTGAVWLAFGAVPHVLRLLQRD